MRRLDEGRRVWCEPTAVDHPSKRATGIALSVHNLQLLRCVPVLCPSPIFTCHSFSPCSNMAQPRHPRDHRPRE